MKYSLDKKNTLHKMEKGVEELSDLIAELVSRLLWVNFCSQTCSVSMHGGWVNIRLSG